MKNLQAVNVPVAKRAVQVGREQKRRFRPVAIADELEEPIFYNDWWFIPIAEDDSEIPMEAERRVNMLKAAEIEVVDLIVAHETTKLLPPPAGESAAEKRAAERERRQKKNREDAAEFVSAVFLILGAILVDPALIAVVRDPDTGEKVWIEVATWYE